jgi:hypothetical protein
MDLDTVNEINPNPKLLPEMQSFEEFKKNVSINLNFKSLK